MSRCHRGSGDGIRRYERGKSRGGPVWNGEFGGGAVPVLMGSVAMWGRGVVWGPGGGGAGGSRWAVLGVGAQWGGVGGAAEAPFGVFNRSRGARSCPMALSARGGRGGGGSDPKWAAESGQRYGSGAGRAAGVCVCVCVWGGCGQCPPRQRLLPAPPGAPCQGRLQSCLGSAAGSCPRSQWGTRPWAARGRCRTGGGGGGLLCFAFG